jgi:hypothetical protein
MFTKNDLWDAGKFVLGGGALALVATSAGATLLPALTIGAGGTALFAWMRSKHIGETSVSADTDTGDRILSIMAKDLLKSLQRVGPSQNSSRVVWVFQKAWNESSGPTQTGLVLQRDGKYTRDTQSALDMSVKAFGISQTPVPAAIL